MDNKIILTKNISNDKLNNKNYITNKNKIKMKTNLKNHKILITEKTTKSMISNFPKSTRQIENKFIDSEKTNFNTINTFNNINSYTYEIFKAKQESLKEKKLYQEKVAILKNHINTLKRKEDELNKRVEMNKEIEKNRNKRKKEIEIIKQSLLSIEIDKRNALEEKKRNVMNQKIKNNKLLKESQRKIIKEKIEKYKKAYEDKKKVEEKRLEIKNKNEEIFHWKIKKIKNERIKIKEKNLRKKNEGLNRINNLYKTSYQNNINETKKLKEELLNLELVEQQFILNLKKTQDYLQCNSSNKNRKKKSNSVQRRNHINNNSINNKNMHNKAYSFDKIN